MNTTDTNLTPTEVSIHAVAETLKAKATTTPSKPAALTLSTRQSCGSRRA